MNIAREITTKKDAESITHTLSKPSKMPGRAYSLPAWACKVGAKLQEVEGSTCSDCYALKGAYQWPSGQNAMTKRLNSLRNPLWVPAMVKLIGFQEWFRWHDSGDLQAVWHLDNIVQVAILTPDTSHWLPTREYEMVREWLEANPEGFPKNLTVRLSAHMVDQPFRTSKKSLLMSLPLSAVHTSKPPKGYQACPVSDPKVTKATCDTFACRSCWDPEVNVSYHAH